MDKYSKYKVWWFNHRPEILWWFWTGIMGLNLILVAMLGYFHYIRPDVSVWRMAILPLLMMVGGFVFTRYWQSYIDKPEEREKLQATYAKLIERRSKRK